MKINLAKSAGFCFGVKRALNIALELNRGLGPIEMFGDIVHNDCVVRQIKKTGIKKISRLTHGKNKTLLIRAHGASQGIFQKAAAFGYRVVDATCPMVKGIHKIVKAMETQGYPIIIIGDKNHDEVRGITGQLSGKALILNEHTPLPISRLRRMKKVAVVSQSTQNLEKVLRIVAQLKKYISQVKFFNTICRPTMTKQQEIRTMPLENDPMIIIGSKSSANTKRLYEISRSLNKKSYWIQSKSELDPRWFKGVRRVGITSGSSTPDSTTQEIIQAIKKMR